MNRKFSDFGIQPEIDTLIGDKIKISKVLNREILVTGFRIKESKYEGQRLDLEFSIGDNKHILFTGSKTLQETIKRIPEDQFPFLTTIIEEDEHYKFS